MSAGPTTDDASAPRAWGERAAMVWIVLVIGCWWLHLHAERIGEYRKLERRVPALATLRAGLDALFWRDDVY